MTNAQFLVIIRNRMTEEEFSVFVRRQADGLAECGQAASLINSALGGHWYVRQVTSAP